MGFKKIADDAESGLLRLPTFASEPPKVEGQLEPPRIETIPAPSVLQPLLEPVPPPSEPTYQQLPRPQPQPKTLPTVASLLNSPVQEMPRERLGWSEPLAPTPLPPTSTLNLPLDLDERKIASPSNASEVSRSQSQGDYYQRSGELARQPSQLYQSESPVPSGPMRDDRYYRDDPRGQSIHPPRYVHSTQQTVLPPVRIHEPITQQSPYYQNPQSPYAARMPPPSMGGELAYVRESYTRSPVHQRLPSLPPQIPSPSDTRSMYYRDTDRQRYPPFRSEEMYNERGIERGYYDDEVQYVRDRVEKDMRIENERRERERFIAGGVREVWRDRYAGGYGGESKGGYVPRGRSLERAFYREYDEIERDRIERYERDRLHRLDGDRVERDRLERDRLERDRLDMERERWARR